MYSKYHKNLRHEISICRLHLEGLVHDCNRCGPEEEIGELDAEIEQLRAALGVAEDQRKAIITVIGVHDPDGAEEFTPRGARSDHSTPARQVTNLLKGRDLRRDILETLRDAEMPIFAVEVSQRYLARKNLEAANLSKSIHQPHATR